MTESSRRFPPRSSFLETSGCPVEAGDVVLADAATLGGDPRGGRVGADRREHARLQGRAKRSGPRTRRSATRTDMVYMNTNVTRGTGVFVVTSTGMSTEVGHISHMLQSAGETDTLLPTKQLKKLTSQILVISGNGRCHLDRPQPVARRELRLVRSSRPRSPSRSRRSPDQASRGSSRRSSRSRDADAREVERDHEAGFARPRRSARPSAINSDKTVTLTLNQMTAVELT